MGQCKTFSPTETRKGGGPVGLQSHMQPRPTRGMALPRGVLEFSVVTCSGPRQKDSVFPLFLTAAKEVGALSQGDLQTMGHEICHVS